MLFLSPPPQLTCCFATAPLPGKRLRGEHTGHARAGRQSGRHRGLAVAGQLAVQEGAHLRGQHHRPPLGPDGSALLQVSRRPPRCGVPASQHRRARAGPAPQVPLGLSHALLKRPIIDTSAQGFVPLGPAQLSDAEQGSVEGFAARPRSRVTEGKEGSSNRRVCAQEQPCCSELAREGWLRPPLGHRHPRGGEGLPGRGDARVPQGQRHCPGEAAVSTACLR